MAKTKCVNLSGMSEQPNISDMNQDCADISDELFDPDVLLRTFGIYDDNCAEQKDPNILNNLDSGVMPGQQSQKQSVIIKNDQMSAPPQLMQIQKTGTQQQQQQQQSSLFSVSQTPVTSVMPGADLPQNIFAETNNKYNFSPVTLEQRSPDTDLVSIPMSALHNILTSAPPPDTDPLTALLSGASNNQRKRRQEQVVASSPVFTVPSPVAISPVYVDQKMLPLNTSDDQVMTAFNTVQLSRPSPQSTPPPTMMDTSESRSWKYSKNKTGRMTPTGKRSRPHTPTSDSESDGGYREREPLQWNSGRNTPVETKPNLRLEDLVDEDKYNKRKRSTSGGEGRRKDPMKQMLEQLQESIPHIGNPSEEKVSHAGLLVEGSDYIRSLKRENNTTKGNVEHMKLKIEQLQAEIEAFQEKLPEHGSSSIHRILSKRGKSIPDMFADHVRQRTQSDWRYWVFTSIMGHFVHSFAQEVSNISPDEMERTATEWVSEKMAMSALRKDAFRKLAKLCSKTSIMEDPSKLPDEARGFVALTESDQQSGESAAIASAVARRGAEFDPI